MGIFGNRFKKVTKIFNQGKPEGELVELLKKHATFNPDKLNDSPIKEVLKGRTLKHIGGGHNARVFKIEGEDWVVKEGKWDITFEAAFIKLPLPASIIDRLMGLFSFFFLPRKKVIKDQYRDYLAFAGYFGYFEGDSYDHPNQQLMFNLQQNIRNSLVQYIPQVEGYYNIKIKPEVVEVLKSKVRNHNFLPREYMLYGPSISRENKGKDTYFIFQDFIDGVLMHDYDINTADKRLRQQLILFAYLQLLMNAQIDMIPDTRPRTAGESFNWLTMTDNIIVNPKRGLVFIDTRWMWRVKSNFVSRGFLIPELAINQAKDLVMNFGIN